MYIIVLNELNMQLLVYFVLCLDWNWAPYVCHKVRLLSLRFGNTERAIGKVSKLSTNRAESKLLTSHTETLHIKEFNEPEVKGKKPWQWKEKVKREKRRQQEMMMKNVYSSLAKKPDINQKNQKAWGWNIQQLKEKCSVFKLLMKICTLLKFGFVKISFI